MKIGVTGHMDLTPTTAELVRAALRTELAAFMPGDLIGVSCLAEGADSLFAQAVLDVGGRLEAQLPAPDYRGTRVSADHLPVFDSLVAQAYKVRYIADRSSIEAYALANAAMIGNVDVMFAVWDGESVIKTGGTAHAVATARARGVRVTVIWPEGARRC